MGYLHSLFFGYDTLLCFILPKINVSYYIDHLLLSYYIISFKMKLQKNILKLFYGAYNLQNVICYFIGGEGKNRQKNPCTDCLVFLCFCNSNAVKMEINFLGNIL